MRNEVIARSGFRDEVSEMVRELLADLPAECRDLAGHDKAGLDRFIDRLLAEGVEDIAARMKAAERGES